MHCTHYGFADNVRFLGYRADTQKLLAATDIVVLPSRIEGLPLFAVEALASGRPVVATAVGGTPEVVIDHETGLLVPPEDSSWFAEAGDYLLGYRELRGRELVEERFDVRTQIERTIALYSDLLQATRILSRRTANASSVRESVRAYSGGA
jgi:glycosyltransferase involved in cell wall biosynthesis